MLMRLLLLVVIDIINILHAAVKTKNHSPVGAYRDSPKTLQPAFERMKPKPRDVHMGNCRSGVKSRQNIPQLVDMFRIYSGRIVLLK